MSRVSLIQLNPRRAADGIVQELRWCHNARTRARFLGVEWQPQVVSLPDSEMDLGFDGAKFGQGATPQIGQLRVAIGKTDSWAGLAWKGAFGSLRSAPWPAGVDDPTDGAFAIDLLFRVESLSIEDGIATFTLIDLGAELRRPLITRKFGATGNALLDGVGVVDMQGRVVPTGWGRLRSVPGILVDRVNNIWLLLDRPSSSIQGFFDGGAAFTMGVARASVAALQAAAPAAGVVDYCLDAGGLTLARPWTAPTYPFTADLTATGNQTAAGIAQSVVATRSTLDFSAGTIAAFNALYPATCGLYVDDERTIATALDELIVRLGGFWRLTGPGEIVLGRLAPAAPAKIFGQTEVASIARQSIVMPTRRRAVGYARNNRVHNEGEIATILLVDDIAGLGDLATQDEVDFGSQVVGGTKPADNATRNVDRGAWVSAALGTAYVVGDEVQDQGSTWGCILANTKTALNGPPTLPTASNSTWRLRAAKGDNGLQGPSGFSNATVYLYQRAASAPAAPSGSFTYTFANGTLSGGTLNGWSQSIPAANGQPLWVIAATASANTATAAILASAFSAPVIDSGAGVSAATIYLYQRAAAAPAVPSGDLTYTFATNALSGSLGLWARTIPSGSNPVWVIVATAVSSGPTDTISSGEWSPPTILAQDGDDALTFSAQPDTVTLLADFAGTLNSGQLPRTVQLTVFEGGANVTSSASYSVSTSGVSIANLGGGAFQIDNIVGETGHFDVTATVGSKQGRKRVTAQRVRSGSNATRAFDEAITVNNAGSYGASNSVELIIGVGPGTVTVSVTHGYQATANTTRLRGKFQYRDTPGSGPWIDVGSSADGSQSDAATIQPGELSFSRSHAGPSSPINREYRYLNFDLDGGTGAASTIYGMFLVTQ